MNLEIENKQTEENVIYYYFSNNGDKFYTGDIRFAKSRAEFYETFKIYMEKSS
jgi:hypothetical protein